MDDEDEPKAKNLDELFVNRQEGIFAPTTEDNVEEGESQNHTISTIVESDRI